MEDGSDHSPVFTPRARASRSAQVGQERSGASSGNDAPHSGQSCDSGIGDVGSAWNFHLLQRETRRKVARWFAVRRRLALTGGPVSGAALLKPPLRTDHRDQISDFLIDL